MSSILPTSIPTGRRDFVELALREKLFQFLAARESRRGGPLGGGGAYIPALPPPFFLRFVPVSGLTARWFAVGTNRNRREMAGLERSFGLRPAPKSHS